jgi:ATP adenylyltransferase
MENSHTSECPFCDPQNSGEVILDRLLVYAIYDKFPVNPGHCLVIPKRHTNDYFTLSIEEQNACWDLVRRVKEFLDEKFHPDGYNIGLNNFPAAGQTIPHVHIHVIPRYIGDVERPEGGIRGVIPNKRKYLSGHDY